MLDFNVRTYRQSFIKRKNINRYKKTSKGTPIIIDKLLNSFDRKIKGQPIFTDDIRAEYLKGLECIFNLYYKETSKPKPTKKHYYTSYLADMYIVFGSKCYREKSLPFKEFVSTGMLAHYKKKFNDKK